MFGCSSGFSLLPKEVKLRSADAPLNTHTLRRATGRFCLWTLQALRFRAGLVGRGHVVGRGHGAEAAAVRRKVPEERWQHGFQSLTRRDVPGKNHLKSTPTTARTCAPGCFPHRSPTGERCGPVCRSSVRPHGRHRRSASSWVASCHRWGGH